MRVVDNRFVCTEKEMKDLAVVDKMFRKTCYGSRCDKCPFRNIRADCTAILFMNRLVEQAKLEERGST